jgi:hypothetical protein
MCFMQFFRQHRVQHFIHLTTFRVDRQYKIAFKSVRSFRDETHGQRDRHSVPSTHPFCALCTMNPE